MEKFIVGGVIWNFFDILKLSMSIESRSRDIEFIFIQPPISVACIAPAWRCGDIFLFNLFRFPIAFVYSTDYLDTFNLEIDLLSQLEVFQNSATQFACLVENSWRWVIRIATQR